MKNINDSNNEISIVIPCLNEEITLERTIRTARKAISKSDMKGEVIISDNGSTDNSIIIAQKMKCRVVKESMKGYGYALQKGINKSIGKYIIIGDADTTYDFCEIIPYLNKLKNGADIVIGSRLAGKIYTGAMSFLHRYIGTPILTLLINLFFGTDISDVNCGLRAFTRQAYNKLNIISGGMEFSSEMIIKAGVYNMQVVEFPCSLHNGVLGRQPHLKTWQDGWRHLRLILLFSPQIIFSFPGWLMLVSGIIITCMVLPSPFQAFGFYMDYHYLFYSIPMTILGYQALWFKSFSTYFVRFSGYLPLKFQTQNHISNLFSLEIWFYIGLLLFLVGTSLLFWLFAGWVAVSYGAISKIRVGIGGMMLIIFGLQTTMNALMISIMKIKIHH